MATRGGIILKQNGEDLVKLYNHYDSYPLGLGKDLLEFLESKRLVNGLSGDYKDVANGMGCLTAQLIRDFKTRPGNLYVEPMSTDLYTNLGLDYVYEIDLKDDVLNIKVYELNEVEQMFDGDLKQYREFLEKEAKNENLPY